MTPIDPKSDALLVASVLSGERDDFAIIVDRYYAAVRAFARGRTRDDASAEDATQESFLVALQRLPQLRKPEKFGPWLFAIARNQCNSVARGKKRVVALEGKHEPAFELDLESREVRAIVRREIEKLPDSARDVLTLHYLGELGLVDVARLLGISHSAARKRLQRAREALSEKLLRALSGNTPAEKAQLVRHKRAVTAIAVGASIDWNTANAAGAYAITGGILAMKKIAIVVALVATSGLVLYATNVDSRTQSLPDPAPAESARTGETTTVSRSEANGPDAGETQFTPAISADADAAPSPHIQGTVLDDMDNPVPDAEVQLRRWTVPPLEANRDDVELASVVTDSDGSFHFDRMDAAVRLSLYAKKDGMIQPRDTRFYRDPYDGRPVVTTLRLYPTATIRGRVIDRRGRPVAGKEVTTFLLNSEELETESGTTGNQGQFEIVGMNPGEHDVAVIPVEQASKNLSDAKVVVGPGEIVDNVEIVYPGDDMVYAGRVIDESGNVVPDVLVQLLGVYDREPADCYTADDGSFRIVRIPEGSYMLMVAKRGYANIMGSAVAGTEDAEFVLQSTVERAVTFRIIDAESREPLAKVKLATVPGREERFETMQYGVFSNKTLSDGWFEDEFPGSWEDMTAIFRADGYLFSYAYIDFLAGAWGETVVEMQRGPIVRGVVVMPNGEPVPNAYLLTGPYPRNVLGQLAASSEMQKSWFATASAGLTGADGTFAIDTLDENMEFLTAAHVDRGFATIPVEFSTIGQEELRIVLSPGAVIRGTVTIGEAPADGAEVRFSREDVPSSKTTNAVVLTESDGSYRFEQMIPGRYRLMARVPQPGTGAMPFAGRIIQSLIDIASDETVVVDFSLDMPVADVSGVVTIGGEPAGSGTIHLTVDAASGVNQYMTQLGPGGTYVIKGIPAGLAHLIATAGDAPTGLTHSSAPSMPVDFYIENEPLVEVNIDVSGGRNVICNVVGLYANESFLSIDVVEGDFLEGDGIAPFGDRIRVARVSGEPGQPLEIPGLHPGNYTAVASAIIMTPQRASRGVRTQRIAFSVPDDGRIEPLTLRIPF